MKVVDRYYMTYNDYGHISNDPKVAAFNLQWGPKSVITFPSGGQKLSGHGVYQIRSEEHTSELQSRENLVCRLLLEKKKKIKTHNTEPTITSNIQSMISFKYLTMSTTTLTASPSAPV